ncbi:hypothetical protein ABHA52_10620 [Enterococcus faecium]|uniref:hypothetical protein n=1 Tax=Enterococcus faecium TaxID=1352 RepID=UPI001106299C|nr:hypothetical protein [Enterococcus faecium]MDB7484784.1 hypothetical protein [Enterococcus faecium]MDB7489822.1 hypothetical protein [Enterococcus faecium]MDB7492400.1 hypothetical protein [Enterococcus faecium]MDB7495028.1 hypothetical protein [Enterococcus faecium]MDB7497488.1 hypothetical protein [Enterococcus faecium]
MDRKVVKYTNEDYTNLENMILNNTHFTVFDNIYKTGFFEKEIVIESNKHNFFQIELSKYFEKNYGNKLGFIKDLAPIVAKDFYNNYKNWNPEDIEEFKTNEAHKDLKTAIFYRLNTLYDSFLLEKFKIYCFLKQAEEEKMDMRILQSDNLDMLLGIDFLVNINIKSSDNILKFYQFIHSINGSESSYIKLEEKMQKKYNVETIKGSKMIDRSKLYNKDLHLELTDFYNHTTKNNKKEQIKHIQKQVESIIANSYFVDINKSLKSKAEYLEIANNLLEFKKKEELTLYHTSIKTY